MIQTKASQLPLPPVADGLPLIGSLLPALGDLNKFLTEQYHKHGPVFKVKVLNRSFTVIAGPEAIEYMAKEDETLTGETVWKPLAQIFGGDKNIAALDGEDHARMRKVMRRGFSRSAATETIPATVETTRKVLRQQPLGTSLLMNEFSMKLIAEVIGAITLGRSAGDYLPDFITVWHGYLWTHITSTKPKSILETPEYKKALARLIEMGEGILAAYERGELVPGDSQFADDLIQASKEQPDLISREDLMFGLLSPYVAGLDTVASIVLYMMYEIVRSPALHARLKPEIDSLFANGTPTPNQLRDVPTLHAIALETMRLYNIASMTPRTAKQSFEIAGHRIEAGETLQMALGITHRLEKFYKNPLVFDVDRMMEPRNEHKQRNAYAPYGSGSHTCLGAGMAEVIMALIVATMVYEADYAIDPPDHKVKPGLSSTLKPAPGFKLKITRFHHTP